MDKMNIPKLPWLVWLIIAILICVVVAIASPLLSSLLLFAAEMMVEFSYFAQAMALPCLCLIMILGAGLWYYNSTHNKN